MENLPINLLKCICYLNNELTDKFIQIYLFI